MPNWFTEDLSAYLNLELQVEKDIFIKNLKACVSDDSMFLHRIFILFKKEANNREYLGNVSQNQFCIQKQKRFYEGGYFPLAKGIISENEGKIIVDIKIIGLKPSYIFDLIFISLLFFVPLLYISLHFDLPWIAPFLISILALYCLILPYGRLCVAVNRLKYDLEREFYYLAHKNTNTQENRSS